MMVKQFAFCAVAAMILLTAAYIGMSKELCRRHLSPADYKSMELDCNSWLYR